MTPEQRKRELPKAILKWYTIESGSRVACIVSEYGNSTLIAEALEEEGYDVKRISFETWSDRRDTKNDTIYDNTIYGKGIYDMIIAVDVLEYASDIPYLLSHIKSLLKPDGKLLIAAENRLAIRYFCGDQDRFTGKNYDGVENYRHLLSWERESMEGRAYSKAELSCFLEQAGFESHRFYSVFPRISNPQLMLAEDYKPNEALDIRIFPEYNNPDTVFLFEEELYPSLLENEMLHAMADGFFIECLLKQEEEREHADQVTLSAERGPEDAMATILYRNGTVKKRTLYLEGRPKLERLMENNEYLSAHGVQMIEAELIGDAFVMPYVHGIPANDDFRRLLMEDKETFLSRLDAFWEIILHSSEHARPEEVDWERFEPGWEKRKKDDPNREKWRKIAFGQEKDREELGVILKRGYLDLVTLNCFSLDGSFVFYDQELYLENVPAKAILLRNIEFIYKFNDQLDAILPRQELFERYGITTYRDLYGKFISHFLNVLRHDDGLSDYFQEGRREYGTILENRKRLNYSGEEYAMIFKDIFHHTAGRKLYLFGSGRYAERFIEAYGKRYPVTGYLDNDKTRQRTEKNGLPVLSPASLKEMNPAEYKVMVCIRNYMPVVKQLRKEGIPNFSVYDPSVLYESKEAAKRRRQVAEERSIYDPESESAANGKKKYNIGYVAGVFDLFHIGHLNLLRRAKEQCHYLIVGVVTDEGVIRHKKSRPKIPFEERIEIVRGCRYVDEAVEIPVNKGDTDEAYRMYKFDVQFSGSDYAEDPKWKAKRDFLQRHGADLIFFPYTEGVSTTQRKDILD